MEVAEDGQEDGKRAVDVAEEVRRGQKDEAHRGYSAAERRRQRWHHCEATASTKRKAIPKSGECCDAKRRKIGERRPEYRMVPARSDLRPPPAGRAQLVPRHGLSRQRYVDLLATPRMSLTCWEKISLVVIAAIGLRVLLRISVSVWKKLIAPNLGLGIDLATQGKWAIVTGATDGIGKAFAQALAEKGLDIVLVSRSLNKLEDVAAEIKQRYAVETRIVQADLTEGQVVYSKIAKAIEELEIGVLVNNAGASYEHPEFFANVPEETLAKILQLNVAGVTGMIRAVLPGMMNRRKGVVINISSAIAVIPCPYLSVYAASKAYVDKLSADLAAEAAPRGVTVQCVLPGPVATKMSKIKRATWMAPTPEKFVEASLKTVGIESRTSGYPPHSLIVGIVNGLRCICERGAVWLVAKTMLNLRGRVVRKKMKVAADDRREPAGCGTTGNEKL